MIVELIVPGLLCLIDSISKISTAGSRYVAVDRRGGLCSAKNKNQIWRVWFLLLLCCHERSKREAVTVCHPICMMSLIQTHAKTAQECAF